MKFYKLAIAFFILSGILLLATPHAWWPAYYDLPYMGWAAIVCALVILILPEQYRFCASVILLLNASGDLGLYELYRFGFPYDKIIHFLSPFFVAMTLLPRWGWRRTILLIIGGAIAWELFEFLADAFIKTHLFGVYRHQIFADTVEDFIMNCLGVILALWIFFRTDYGVRYMQRRQTASFPKS